MVPFSSKREIKVGDSFSLFNIYPYIYYEIISILSYWYNPRTNTNFLLLKVNTTCPSVFYTNSRTCTRFKPSKSLCFRTTEDCSLYETLPLIVCRRPLRFGSRRPFVRTLPVIFTPVCNSIW